MPTRPSRVVRRSGAGLVRGAIAVGTAALLSFGSIQAANAWGLPGPLADTAAPATTDAQAPGPPEAGAAPGDTTAEPVPAASAPQKADPERPGEIGFDEPLRPSAPPGPRVRLNANRPQTWLQKQFNGNEWRDICTGSCLIHTSPNGMYRLGGRSLRPTDPFQLPRTSGSVLIEGKMGTNAQHYTGIGLTIGGVVEALGSVVLLSMASSAAGQPSQDHLLDKDFYTFSAVLGFLRAAVLLGVGMTFIGKSTSSAEVR